MNDMPSGVGRAQNLEAMSHPAWVDVRKIAKSACVELSGRAIANHAYFKRGVDAT